MTNCIFCNREKIRTDIIKETDNFFVKVGKGIIAPGHVMIITKKHYLSFAELPTQYINELSYLEKYLSKIIRKAFKTSVFGIEYGIWGQSIHHAHIHIIPLKGPGYDIKNLGD